MEQFVSAVQANLATQNWLSGLALALALPDTCSKLVHPNTAVGVRYAAWFDEFVGERYKARIGPDKRLHCFLSGPDCYALRCAYLHEGDLDITGQRARKVLERFRFTRPIPGLVVHLNGDRTLQLQVDIFCRDILEGVRTWLDGVRADEEVVCPVRQNPRAFSRLDGVTGDGARNRQ